MNDCLAVWLSSQALLHGADQCGLRVERIGAERDVVEHMVQIQPALLLLELVPGWREIAKPLKLSPATRKIPLIGLGQNSDQLQTAVGKGPDVLLTSAEFLAEPCSHIHKHKRGVDVAELTRQSALPLPAHARAGVELFNQKKFFEQHEAFEHAWHEEPGPVRALYQGVLQVGVAYLQIQRGNCDGARKMFQRARQYLAVLPEVCQSIDVAQLRRDADRAQSELERLGSAHLSKFDPALFAPLRLI